MFDAIAQADVELAISLCNVLVLGLRANATISKNNLCNKCGSNTICRLKTGSYRYFFKDNLIEEVDKRKKNLAFSNSSSFYDYDTVDSDPRMQQSLLKPSISLVPEAFVVLEWVKTTTPRIPAPGGGGPNG